jgi:hypothetical protein
MPATATTALLKGKVKRKNRPAYAFREDASLELLTELIYEEGEIVFINSCTVNDGIGSGDIRIYDFGRRFWIHDDNTELAGPYDTLLDAIGASESVGGTWTNIDCAEQSIQCPCLSATEIVAFLHVERRPENRPYRFAINGKPYQLGLDGTITPVTK